MSAGPFLADRLITWLWPWGRRFLDGFPHRRQIFVWLIVLGVFWAGFAAWKDEHQARLVAGKPPLDPLMLYQDGFSVASFDGIRLDASNNTIGFGMITSSRELDMSRPFEFREWQLLCSGTPDGMATFGAMKQINYIRVVCRIEGTR